MKRIISTLVLITIVCIIPKGSHAQFVGSFFYQDDEENKVVINDSTHPCISSQEYASLETQCSANIARLGLSLSMQKGPLNTLLNWPIKAAEGFNDCDYYFIGAYVDQNIAATSIQDFDCGSNTYDGHHGTDIAIWPYGFYKMDNSQVEVIAAAPGTIIQKADGNFDRNCAANNLTANSIIIQHADGSRALYWHMKKNSLTPKEVGQTVVQGEYLGVVGSSGSASGPHLHFEVWSGNLNTSYIDPFSGPCNAVNNTSWWNNQRPHHHPYIIKVSTNTTDIVLPGCPNTETPNESASFEIPFQGPGLAPGYAKFYIFLRDEAQGLIAECKIINTNGSILNSWTYTSTAANKINIRGFSKLLPTTTGSYIFQSTYNGITCSQSFDVNQANGYSDVSGLSSFEIINDPSNASFTLFGHNIDNGLYNFKLMTISGNSEINVTEYVSGNSIQKMFSTSSLPIGMYILLIESETARIANKLVILHQ